MTAATVAALISAGAGLLGAVIGAGASVFAAALQHRREMRAEVEREHREEARERATRREDREREAAAVCDRLLTSIGRKVRAAAMAYWEANFVKLPHERSYPSLRPIRNETEPLFQQLDEEMVHLPEELAGRVDEIVGLLQYYLLDASFDFNSTEIYVELTDEVHQLFATWLRGDALPARSDRLCDCILLGEEAIHRSTPTPRLRHPGFDSESSIEEWREARREALREIRERP